MPLQNPCWKSTRSLFCCLCCSYSDLIHSSFFYLSFQVPSVMLVYFGFATQHATPCAVFVDSSFTLHEGLLMECLGFFIVSMGSKYCTLSRSVSLPGKSWQFHRRFFSWLLQQHLADCFATGLNPKQVFYIISGSFLKPQNSVLGPKKRLSWIFSLFSQILW